MLKLYEIIGRLDDNEREKYQIGMIFFKRNPEGSFFDGSDAMEQFREERGKLLLRQMLDVFVRQNARTAGFHTESMQQIPTTSSTIAQPTQPMDVDAEFTQQATPAIPSSSTTQASQLNAELTQRANTATKGEKKQK